jgi:hypothetical protein
MADTIYRFYIDNVQGGTSHSNVAMAEVELRLSIGGADQTGSGTADASGNIGSGYVAAKAIDDTNSTMWNSGFSAGNSWWQVAFPTDPGTIAQLAVRARESFLDDTPTEFRVVKSTDGGSSFQPIWEDFSTTADWTGSELRTFIPVELQGWAHKIAGITPANVNGVAVANIASINGV